MIDYIELLKKKVVPAEGCTEPVAVAYAVSLAAEQLAADVTDVRLRLSANVIKNALGVGIPGTGMVGIEIAAALGAVVRQSTKKLEVLQGLTSEQLAMAKGLVDARAVSIEQKSTSETLYIEAILTDGSDTSRAIVCRDHTNVVRVEKNGEALVDRPVSVASGDVDCNSGLTVDGIYEFATTAPFEDIDFILGCVPLNTRMSEEGLRNGYGLEVGRRMSVGSDARGALLNNLSLRLIRGRPQKTSAWAFATALRDVGNGWSASTTSLGFHGRPFVSSRPSSEATFSVSQVAFAPFLAGATTGRSRRACRDAPAPPFSHPAHHCAGVHRGHGEHGAGGKAGLAQHALDVVAHGAPRQV